MTELTEGWMIDDKPASEAEVAEYIASADLDSIAFNVSVDGAVFRTVHGVDGAEQAARDLLDRPTTATFTERLCYGIGALSLWAAVLIMVPSATVPVAAAILVGMAMVNHRVGLGPLA